MDTTLKDQVQGNLTKAQNILIAVSKNSGLDGLASGLALYLSLRKLKKNVTIFAKDPTVNDARLLYGVGDIGKKLGSKDLVIEVNDAIKNVDKVTYNLDKDVLKIVIHALPTSHGVNKEDLTFNETYSAADLLISIGYTNGQELNTDIEHGLENNTNIFIINIDKATPDKKFAQIEIIDHQSPSISETVTGLTQLVALPVDEDIAFNLYTGIASATRMFSPSVARPQTLSTAAWLLKIGAGKAGLAQKPNPEQSQPQDIQIQPATSQLQTEDTIQQQENYSQTQGEINTTPIEQVEREVQDQEDWLKPPKIYRGSKSFDIES